MNSKELVSSLIHLVLPNIDFKIYDRQSDYLKWFWEISLIFFVLKEQFDISNEQNYSFENPLSADFANNILTSSLYLFNTDEISKDKTEYRI